MLLSVIIPAYNEEKTIKEIIDKVKHQKTPGFDKEIIVVNDGSKDNTADILKGIKGIKLVNHKKNKGKGFAIRTGLSKVEGDYVLIQDADLELSPEDYPALLKPVLEKRALVVYGSRILGEKKGAKHTWNYYIGGKGVTFVANLLYGIRITDEPIGYKLFKTEILRGFNLECKKFEFCPEVTAKVAKSGIKIHEVPVRYNPRTKEDGKKLNWRDGVQAVWTLWRYRFKK